MIPVIRDGQTIALLQCGQVHDRVPSAAEWREARRSLVSAGIRARELRPLFQRNRVLTPARQEDLLELLALVAARLDHSGASLTIDQALLCSRENCYLQQTAKDWRLQVDASHCQLLPLG